MHLYLDALHSIAMECECPDGSEMAQWMAWSIGQEAFPSSVP